ncbi:phage exclusion protein Lit family protein [Bradyrhizobium sp. SZCCHNS3055]|uniref:phage exclusion protein Lit family protein n=1 Tax=Bradyrhizobium sp. SZCCHNS3055 TaxID=3057323 RepID=UPI0028E4AD55|nr:phage exclusion protein Lit family protein [Bradyrhizobium sp. SZCCHNS3055]
MPDVDDIQDFTQGALSTMMQAAPERSEALRKLFDDHRVRVRHTSLESFRQGEVVDPSPSTIMGVIQFPPVMHTVAWLLAHGGWEAMRNYGAAIMSFHLVGAAFSGGDIEAALTRFPDAARCDEIIDCAVQNVHGVEVPPPAWLPNISDTSEDPDTNRQYSAVKELWLIAQCWFFLHELQHILLASEGEHFPDFRKEELACDERATAWLLDGVDFYSDQRPEEPSDKVRGKRAMGILVGLFCIGFLSDPDGSPSHPPLRERINVLLGQVGAKDAAHFWHFAAGLLFVLSRDRKSSQFPAFARIRDIVLLLVDMI